MGGTSDHVRSHATEVHCLVADDESPPKDPIYAAAQNIGRAASMSGVDLWPLHRRALLAWWWDRADVRQHLLPSWKQATQHSQYSRHL
jgi:hypothetical protein